MKEALALEEGSYRFASGENPRTRDVGVAEDTLLFLIEDLPDVIGEDELKWVGDQWLGRAIKVKSSGAGPVALPQRDGVMATLQYLERPRKIDQVERATKKRRAVRLTVRLLDLANRLEALPLAKAVPIPKATLLKGQGATSFGVSATTEGAAKTGDVTGSFATDDLPPSAARAPQKPVIDAATRAQIAEVESFFTKDGLVQLLRDPRIRRTRTTLPSARRGTAS
ncbi:MAG: hypothetical protein HC923_01660 [Myxococcales bacterium]|nr:hypothetical protein [Myxococcales bacterium]